MSEVSEVEARQQPHWIVNARTREFIAGARSQMDALNGAFKLNNAAKAAGTTDRYAPTPRES